MSVKCTDAPRGTEYVRSECIFSLVKMILMLATDTHTVHPACGRGGNENISNEAFSFMNQLGLRLIANIRNWDDDGVATAEYAWLRRSEERRGGKEWVRRFSVRGAR